jgi:hypothetical protein
MKPSKLLPPNTFQTVLREVLLYSQSSLFVYPNSLNVIVSGEAFSCVLIDFFLNQSYPFFLKQQPNTMAGFDLTTHCSASKDDTTRPRPQGIFSIFCYCHIVVVVVVVVVVFIF